jgi:ribA/ribD-fused uncharacterized protein
MFKTNENFYQAMKLPKEEVNLRKQIAYMLPNKAKLALRDQNKFITRWDWTDDLKLQVMEFGLRWKFQPEALYWHPKLISTGDEELIEINTWHDNFWGNCICAKCEKIKGQNWLGKLLMKIRQEYKHVN